MLKDGWKGEHYKMYDELYSGLPKTKRTGHNQYVALCPFHTETEPSFSFNTDKGLFYCHSCDKQGNAYEYAKSMGYPNPHKYIEDNGTNGVRKDKYPTDLVVPLQSPQKDDLNKLMKEFKSNLMSNIDKWPDDVWDNKFIDMYGVGLNKENKFTYGYYNNDELIGIKVHKSRTYGDGGLKWYVANNIASFDRNKDLYICEGEKDVLSLLSLGYQAVSGTAGAKSIPKDLDWLRDWKNDIYICYDNDEAGAKGSKKLANEIIKQHPHLIITIIDWGDKAQGYDVTDSMEDYHILMNACLNGKQVETSKNIGGLKLIKGVEAIKREIRPRQQIIENLLPEKSQVVLGGTTGANKSFMAMQLAMSLANDEKEFLGFKIKVNGLNVLYCDTECGEDTMIERFKAITQNFPDWNNARFNMVSRVGMESDVYDDLESAINIFKPDVLVIDCLYNTTDGADISRNEKLFPTLKRITKLRDDYDLTILAIHHMNKGNHQEGLVKDRMSGGSVLINWCEHINLIQRTNESHLRLLKVDKSRHMAYSECYYVLEWDSDKCLLINRGITEDWSKYLITSQKKNNWEKVLRDLGDEFTTNDFKNKVEVLMGHTEKTAHNWLKQMCEVKVVEKIKQGNYKKKLEIITSED